ncbi:hypothetical protein WMF20_18365 [Sorangium sp. So ce834]|uniref:hypothetical protein n=1 Tax=Sorangium sp. So ce834 TaxID=3133321 RepID=UPI003F638526
MTTGEALEVRYAWLDGLPEPLFRRTVTHTHGRIAPRGAAILALRDALLSGRVPPADAVAWPEEDDLRRALFDALAAANVGPYCDGDPRTTDEVLAFVLDVVGDAEELHDRALIAFHSLARERDAERARRGSGACGPGAGDGGGRVAGVPLDERQWEEARRDAMRLLCELVASRTEVRWSELVTICAELERAFRQLAEALDLPPGSCRGMLRALPRGDLLEMRRLLGYAPALEELVRTLGRMRAAADASAGSSLEQVGEIVARPREVSREVQGDRGPEIRGIERSSEVSRMLASEAALLARPALRRLWRARWAERALLTYRARGVFTQRIQEVQAFEDGQAHEERRAERGPVLVVLDTSGSMERLENVAKAVVLQIAGACFVQQRACYLYIFSGPGDLAEHELSFDGDGLAGLLAFLSLSFHGGTDIDEALRRACGRIGAGPYRQADIAVISDGCFCLGDPVRRDIRRVRSTSAARIHGIRVGAGEGFDAIGCDSLHEVSMWLGGLLGSSS